MQDSLEDYIRISNSAKPEQPVKISKEVHITVQRKTECDARAMKIVEFSIEGKLRPEIFTRCLSFINRSHYQDIVEERAITKICGYSICGKRIPDMPKKQYYISTKNNKVYDITDRKNYCSNFCYTASQHIKKQIDDSPLWLRKLDDIPEYQLLESSEGVLPGEYIDQGIAKPSVDAAFTSISAFTDVSLKDIIEKEKGKDVHRYSRKGIPKKLSKMHNSMQTITENLEQLEEEPVSINIVTEYPKKTGVSHLLPVIDENEEKTESKVETDESMKENSESLKSTAKKHKKKNLKELEALIKKLLKEWFTLESYIFLHGESKIKQVLDEKKLSSYFDKLNIAELQRDQQVKYMDICKRLHLEEMADEKFDKALLGNNKLKPIPDYRKLKSENKDLTIKVKCFYSGVLHEKEDTNFPTKINKREEEAEDEPLTLLPLVDASSQNSLRRKIFLNAISKAMQNLLQALRIKSFGSVMSDVQNLVKTFKLKADNVVLKPMVWNIIAAVFLNILTIQDQNIKRILEEKSSQEYIELQLSAVGNKNEFLYDVMTIVQDIDMFVENYVSST